MFVPSGRNRTAVAVGGDGGLLVVVIGYARENGLSLPEVSTALTAMK
jgi:hypothetical protein